MKNRYLLPASNRAKRGNKPRNPAKRELRKLTRKQELFVRELVSKDGTTTLRDAAIAAGFAASSAHQRAYEMTNSDICPHVCRAIRIYRGELDRKYAVNYGRHIKDLQTIRDQALENGAYSAAVQAEKARGQAQGDIYVSKSEIRTGSIDQMDRAQVETALAELKAQYESIAVDRAEKSPDPDKEEEETGKLVLENPEESNSDNAAAVAAS